MYRQIEEITDRKGEKILLFLTLENIAGAGIGGLLGGGLGMALLGGLLGGALLGLGLALAGLALTLDRGGMPGYTRLMWGVRGALRRRLRGARITPDDLHGARVSTRRDRPLPVNGAVRVRRRDALAHTGYGSGSGYRGASDAVSPPSATKEAHDGNYPARQQPAD